MDRLASTLLRISTDLKSLRCRWALVGGLAVVVRAEPRLTRDVDVVVAVSDDHEAEILVRTFFGRGYRQLPRGVFEQLDQGRLATMRFVAPGLAAEGTVVDLLFASSGIEAEIVAGAELMMTPLGLEVPVATIGHLIAMKVLSSTANPKRFQDAADLRSLFERAQMADLDQARRALDLIAARGFHRGADDLQTALTQALELARQPG